MHSILKTTGLIAAPFTPMHEDGRMNLSVISGYAEHLGRFGIKGVFIGGTTGEGITLSLQERMDLCERWVSVAGSGLRVIAHVGHNSLEASCELAKHAARAGAQAIAGLAPFFYRPSSVLSLVEWCRRVAAAAPDLPFYYYHIPSMTGVSLSMLDFLAEANSRIPTLAGIKFTHEDIPEFAACVQAANGRFDMLFGRDELLLSGHQVGARGAVGSTYNFAAPLYNRILSEALADPAQAARLQAIAVQIIQIFLNCGANPLAAMKAHMRHLGVNCGPARLPLDNPTTTQNERLETALATSGLYDWAPLQSGSATRSP
jgi:N-acetylneuraminate lyase